MSQAAGVNDLYVRCRSLLGHLVCVDVPQSQTIDCPCSVESLLVVSVLINVWKHSWRSTTTRSMDHLVINRSNLHSYGRNTHV